MSKAFTSEETPEPAPVLRAPPRLAPGEVRYVTPEGHAALVAELAGAQGERARFLEGTLAALTVLGPEAAPPGKAGFGTWVTVEGEDGARRAWRLVGPDEADVRRGLLSVDSPLGRALLGREAGEAVEVERPRGRLELSVIAVGREPPSLE
ncbi:GreA/GreB family elongation factor [Anaeromyxobacter paludicola]|uniref:Transcription elongation factor GreB n=1 Tax=Anaeromyxobacter paludicola TaxID=2918171 RepID=A0ABN6N683_9BACT|nr:GreA/GreB family elongation factor [Anaeromyxobacter paludicola]BDG07333.1 transcription elongation factor GreB [Anaeromyxobacter paludicola]